MPQANNDCDKPDGLDFVSSPARRCTRLRWRITTDVQPSAAASQLLHLIHHTSGRFLEQRMKSIRQTQLRPPFHSNRSSGCGACCVERSNFTISSCRTFSDAAFLASFFEFSSPLCSVSGGTREPNQALAAVPRASQRHRHHHHPAALWEQTTGESPAHQQSI